MYLLYNWQAGASQPSYCNGPIFSIRRCHTYRYVIGINGQPQFKITSHECESCVSPAYCRSFYNSRARSRQPLASETTKDHDT